MNNTATLLPDLRIDADVLGEYFGYLDEHYNKLKGNAYRYKPSDSLKCNGTEEFFYIVDSWDFIRELNSWLKESKYHERLVEETRYDIPEDPNEAKYFITWLDYLTEDMWGFSDEYGVCEECQKAIRTSPDGAYWKPDYWRDDNGYLVCEDCLKDEDNALLDDYLDTFANNPDNANTILSDLELEKAGYEKVNKESFENGWYGVTDDPKKILKELLNKDLDGVYIFSINSSQPFCTMFDVWKKKQ